ncbi:MAG TPA: PadR family transcriptional regulator [Gemmatimonadaceae bacterium]|nr:PadR family transcriptional regulator [Gemmatimonadaceae bacterium]
MPPTPSRSERDPESRIPLKAVDFLLLLMLARSGDRHGYGIMQDVAEHTEGGIELEAGSLYRTIRRLQDDGLVEESSRRPAADLDDERRRYYRLTPFGRKVVAAEASRLRRLVRIAESVRLLAPQGAR